jgi:threonine aldolase
MPDQVVDLRSDTVTRPSKGMRAAMAAAEVGDDIYGEDPTANELQAKVAALLGKEAGLFVPSGTMSNQLAIKGHTQPGDEIICEQDCHLFNYEASGPAVNSLVMPRPIKGERGVMRLEDVARAIRPNNIHAGRTSLITVENTHNRAGGRIYPLAEIIKLAQLARERQIAMHLDGARLWNAVVETGIPPKEWCQYFDSVSVCFSKGLGAPVGSVLCGSYEFIQKALRWRKILGGGMRQVGILAAACLYALEHNLERLKEDHANARYLAQALQPIDGLEVNPQHVETNMVMIYVRRPGMSAADLSQALAKKGILINAVDQERLRAVTHLDVNRQQIELAIATFKQVLS